MKKMTKALILLLMISFGTSSTAQIFGIRGGANLGKMLIKDGTQNFSDSFDPVIGFHAGFSVEYPINETFAFETGVLYSTTGVKFNTRFDFIGEIIETQNRFTTGSLEVPLTGKAYLAVGELKIYGALGPYIGIGLNGKSKIKSVSMGVKETREENISWGSDENEDELKRMNFGAHFGVGVDMDGLQVGLFYALGLANISVSSGNGETIRNRALGFSIGYKFNQQ